MSAYESEPSVTTVLDEVIFELAADLAGPSKTINDLYWIRNRINSPYERQQKVEKGGYALQITKNRLKNLFKDFDNINLNKIIEILFESFIKISSKTFYEKIIISIKRVLGNIKKKRSTMRAEGVYDIYTLLNDNKIEYKKNDLNNLLTSLDL